MRRWITATVMGVAAAALLAGCASLPAGIDGDLTNSWSKLGDATPFVPKSGVCHEAESEPEMSSYRPVDCAKEHIAETIFVGTFTGAAATSQRPPVGGQDDVYPDCAKRAADFLGAPSRGGNIAVKVVPPGDRAWWGGARWYRCDLVETALVTADAVPRKGTLAKSLTGAAPLALRCFNPTIGGEHITRMAAVPCAKPHHAEFVGTWTAPAAMPYDTAQNDEKRISKGCFSAIARYAKVPDDGKLRYRTGWIRYIAAETEWEHGERDIQCFLWLSDKTLTGSAKGRGNSGLPINYA
jgi:hypothetical protein